MKIYRLYSADNTLIAEFKHRNLAERSLKHYIGARIEVVNGWIVDFAD